MANQHRIGKHATKVDRDGDVVRVRYHNTDVVTVNRLTGSTTLNTGGWSTPTTKTRMNQAANQFALGFRVYQKNWDWFVETADGRTIPFERQEVSFNYK